MTRHVKIGCVVAVAVIIVIALPGLLGWSNPILNSIGDLLGLPGWIFVCICALFNIPIPNDETNPSSWGLVFVIVAIIVAALFWGFVAGLLSRYVFTKRDNKH